MTEKPLHAVRATVQDRLNSAAGTDAAAIIRLAQLLDAALPQTQCTRCGYPDCAAYAHAIADGSAAINQCPPGGAAGVARLAHLTGKPVLALNPVHGVESIRFEAVIDEAWCIGCTLCLKACPVDCIVGAPKLMHTVIDADCTGCELCLPACPVDCISMRAIPGGQTGWLAWSEAQAAQARERYAFHREREQRDELAHTERLAASAPREREAVPTVATTADADSAAQARRAVIEAAMARARAARAP